MLFNASVWRTVIKETVWRTSC